MTAKPKVYISSAEKRHLEVLTCVSKIYEGVKIDTIDELVELHHSSRRALKNRLKHFESEIDGILTSKLPNSKDGLKIRDNGVELIWACQEEAKKYSFYNNSFFIAINLLFTYFVEGVNKEYLPKEYHFLADVENYLYIFEKEEKLLEKLEVSNENIKIAYDGLKTKGYIKSGIDSGVKRRAKDYLERLKNGRR